MVYNANKQGRCVPYAQQQSNGAAKQGIRVPYSLSRQQSSLPYYSPYVYPFSQESTAKQQSRSVWWPMKQGFNYHIGWPQKNAEEQQGFSYNFNWPQQQGINVPFGEEQGFTVNRSPTKMADQEGFRVTLPQTKQNAAKEQGISFNWPQKQGKNVPFGEEQGFTVTVPLSKMADQEGYRVYLPQTKQNAAKEQGRRVSFGMPQAQGRVLPFYNSGYEQGITYTYPEAQESAEKQGFFRNIGRKLSIKFCSFSSYYNSICTLIRNYCNCRCSVQCCLW